MAFMQRFTAPPRPEAAVQLLLFPTTASSVRRCQPIMRLSIRPLPPWNKMGTRDGTEKNRSRRMLPT